MLWPTEGIYYGNIHRPEISQEIRACMAYVFTQCFASDLNNPEKTNGLLITAVGLFHFC